MECWKKDSRREVVMVDIDELVPKDHLLRKVERVMDYDLIYEKLDSYYSHDVGRPHKEIQMNIAYRWFLGYSLLENIPHFATVSYAFCNRFPAELSEEIFTHILNKALNNRMVDPTVIFIDTASKCQKMEAEVFPTLSLSA